MKSLTRSLPLTALALGALTLAPAQAAGLWAGADVTTKDFKIHAGSALLPIPLIGTLGVEGGVNAGLDEFRIGATLRDLNLPLTRLNAYLGGGLSYQTSSANSGAGLYLQGGVRGPLFGPLGWRAGLDTDTKSGFSAGLGLEVRF
ncbi:hypothetical protein [Deinococcus sp.]|uniref:hypothetical protein n=1 Tax=Deinococcus sp. TaxID=47478 RepID=UPI003B5C1F84